MGIDGLLGFVGFALKERRVSDLRGLKVAVDASSWLYAGASFCAKELCKELPTTRLIDYVMNRVNMLKSHGVIPTLVFDGDALPIKSELNDKRNANKSEKLLKAKEHETKGDDFNAGKCYKSAVKRSFSIVYELIQVLRLEEVSYIVAPYEADSQMAYMALNNTVDAVITEDADLIAFGCPKIFFKMDRIGNVQEFDISRLFPHPKFEGFSQMMFVEMCILSGCDYLHKLPKMSLTKAHELFKNHKTREKVIEHLKSERGAEVSPQYIQGFEDAFLTFRHQRVFDRNKKEVVHLHDLAEDLTGRNLDFLGPAIPPEEALAISRGDCDPSTRRAFELGRESMAIQKAINGEYKPNFRRPPRGKTNSAVQKGKKRLNFPAQTNSITNYYGNPEAKRKPKATNASSTHSVEPCDLTKKHTEVRLVLNEDQSGSSKFEISKSVASPFLEAENSPYPVKRGRDADQWNTYSRRKKLGKQVEKAVLKAENSPSPVKRGRDADQWKTSDIASPVSEKYISRKGRRS